MKKVSVGIDISKDTFMACLCFRSNEEYEYSNSRKFKNEKAGYNQLTKWVSKFSKAGESVFLMEATGVYHEDLANHLFKIKKNVHVVLPNTSKHFFKSLNIKTKTDSIDARVLSQFGAERKHQLWTPPEPIFKQLRELTRFNLQLKEQRTALKNIKHSKESAHEVDKYILKSNTQIITHLDNQITKCQSKIEELISSDEGLKEKINKVCTIPGVQLITASIIVAETNGFELFNNAKQLASFAGYDVVHNESGSSVHGKTRISKKGNRYIRQAMYMPAMSSSIHNPDHKKTYIRIIKKKSSKMIGQVAIQRKLLLLIYSLWKTDNVFIPNFYAKKIAQQKSQATQDNSVMQLP